eukprot:7186519-Alexandrium_andersonii.AAC.1
MGCTHLPAPQTQSPSVGSTPPHHHLLITRRVVAQGQIQLQRINGRALQIYRQSTTPRPAGFE